ncbi:MAG TPA: hypothetical protein VKL40_15050 [Candidatus Angelobacter sp.]|nr:hypothetical protein [Candidatus Angelobacter sp.]
MSGMLSGEERSSSDGAPAAKPVPDAALVFAIIAATAFAAIVPTFRLGNVSGHDFEFHLNSWMEVAGQWQQGIIYPRWAAMAHYGYGEPRFIFYPPASWMFGAALGKVLPWKLVPGVFIWAVLTAAGCTMFALARNWLPRQDAVFAAALYAVNPYHLVIVYWRSAFAELMASLWLPLLLLFVLRLEKDGHKAMLCLSLVLAGTWLTNAPAAVMVNYSLVLLVGVAATVRRSPRILPYAAGACALGLGLAAFYVLPAAYEQRWVNINEALSLIVRPSSNFLFTRLPDPDHNRFNLLVSVIAVLEIAIFALAVWLSRRRRRDHPEFWWSLTWWGSVAALLMLPFTLVLWQYLPQLRFVQLPWRWLLCLNVAFALVVTMGMRGWRSRCAVSVLMLASLLVVWNRLQPPWWDKAADIKEMADAMSEDQGYEGVDEYLPRGADPSLLKPKTPLLTADEGTTHPALVDPWSAESREFTIAAEQPSQIVLRLLNYPAWRVEVNDRPATTETHPDTGQMMIPVEPGTNKVKIAFVRTRDRTAGDAVSAGTGLLIILLAVWKKRD